MSYDPFEKFLFLSRLGTREEQQEFAQSMSECLTGSSDQIVATTQEQALWERELEPIIMHRDVQELCQKNSTLQEDIAKELLGYVCDTESVYQRLSYDTLKDKREALELVRAMNDKTFVEAWSDLESYYSSIYSKGNLDISFYKERIAQTTKRNKKDGLITAIREHFLEECERLLKEEELALELALIDEARSKFLPEFYARIKDLLHLYEELEPLLGELGRLWDLSKGNLKQFNVEQLKRYAQLLESKPEIKRLAELLGRMQEVNTEYEEELYATQVLVPYPIENRAHPSEVVGIVEGNDLARVLPSELILLKDADTELIFLKKYAEHQLLCFDYSSKEQVYREENIEELRQKAKDKERGPFILCIDTSGSMHGTPELIAKVLSLALVKIARREKRSCYLITFSTGIHTMDLSPQLTSVDGLIDFLSHSFHGGTDAVPALEEAVRKVKEKAYNQSDIIFVSDFVMSPSKELIDKVAEAKSGGNKFYSLTIGSSANSDVTGLFDYQWHYDERYPEKLREVVDLLHNL